MINNLPQLSNYKGKYNLTYSFDIDHLDITKNQQETERFNVFHITFPSFWTKAEIFDLLSPFRPGQIGWINDTSAFIALDDVSNSKDVNRVLTISKGGSSECSIKPYKTFMEEKCSTINNQGKRKLDEHLIEDEKTIETSTPLIKKAKSSNKTVTTHERTIFDNCDDW